MKDSVSAGYTIAELSLFLGLSALLLIVAIIGTGSSIRVSRFTDSTNSLHAYVQQQYDDVLNGINDRPTAQACNNGNVTNGTQNPGASNCIVMGRMLFLGNGQSSVTVYTIVGTEPASPNFSESDAQLIADYQPMVVRSVGATTYDVPWLATFSGSNRAIDGTAVDSVAFISSPRSSNILNYTFKDPGGASLAPVVTDVNATNQPATFCLKSADGLSQPSEIGITAESGESAVTLSFDAPPGDCNGR